MADVSIIKLRVRRGSDADRRKIILDDGELGFVTDRDSLRLTCGDSVMYGGYPIGSKIYSGSIGTLSFRTAINGDLIYNTGDCRMYVLTGTAAGAYLSKSSYTHIGTKTDNILIQYNERGKLSVKNTSISASHIHPNTFDKDGGFKKNIHSKVQVNYDNASIKISDQKKLYVDPRYVNWSILPRSNSGPGTFWINVSASNRVEVGY